MDELDKQDQCRHVIISRLETRGENCDIIKICCKKCNRVFGRLWERVDYRSYGLG